MRITSITRRPCLLFVSILAAGMMLAACSTGSSDSADPATNTDTATDTTSPTGSGGNDGSTDSTDTSGTTTTTGGTTAGTGTEGSTGESGTGGSTGGSTGETSDPTTPTSPTTPATPPAAPAHTVIAYPNLSDIVGTWRNQWTARVKDLNDTDGDGDTSEIINTIENDTTLIVFADGTYIERSPYTSDNDGSIETGFYYTKGTLSLTNGFYMKKPSSSYTCATILTEYSGVSWTDLTGWETNEQGDEMSIVDGDLYLATYHRQSGGPGVLGTWVRRTTYQYEDDNGDPVKSYSWITCTLTNTQMSWLRYSSNTPDFDQATSDEPTTQSYTANGDGTYTDSSDGRFPNTFFVANDDVLEYVGNRYAKQ